MKFCSLLGRQTAQPPCLPKYWIMGGKKQENTPRIPPWIIALNHNKNGEIKLIPTSLVEETFDCAEEFYRNMHYYWPYQISIDATAVIPTSRIQGNIVYELAVEGSIKVHSTQDIVDLLAKNMKKRNLEILSSCTRYPTFILSSQRGRQQNSKVVVWSMQKDWHFS